MTYRYKNTEGIGTGHTGIKVEEGNSRQEK